MTQKDSVPERSHEWPEQRLRFSIVSNPVRSEVADRPEDGLVSFVPMEAVGEFGELDATQERQIADVYTGYTYFAEGDVIVAKITPCFENGKGAVATGLCNGVGFGTTELHVLRAEVGISNRWLYYVTASERFRRIGESEMLGAGGQKRVPEDFIKDFLVGVPEFEEQEQIADFLDWKTGQIDALIAKKRALIERLKEKRLAVITHAVTGGLHPHGTLKESGIPWISEIPSHWEAKRLRYCTSAVTSGSRGWAQFFSDDGALFLRITNLSRDSIQLAMQDIQRVDPPYGEEGSRTSTRSGDLLISITADLGSVAVVPENLESAYVSQHLALVRLDDDAVHPEWIAYSVLSLLGKAQLLMAGYGGTKIQLNLNDIKEIAFCYPPDEHELVETLEHIRASVAKIDSLLGRAESAAETLLEYRSAQISAAVTGKLDVRHAAIPVAT